MRRRAVAICVGLALLTAVGTWGCATSQRELSLEELTNVPGDKYYHEWSKVITVNIEAGKAVRKHVGFIDRRFSEEDPEGKVFVLDRAHNELGFLLPSGRTYAYKIQQSELVGVDDLGNRGESSGIKAVLRVTGRVETEEVTGASTSPPGA